MFDRKTPCGSCPFRADLTPYLTAGRVASIFQAPAFQCHKTIDYDKDVGDPARKGSKPQQCVGLMLVLHRSEHPNQIMQVGERLGAFDLAKLSGPVYNDLWEAIDAHGGDPVDDLPRWLQRGS